MLIIIPILITVIVFSLYRYYIYSAVPVEPDLSASAKSNYISIDGFKRQYLIYIPKILNEKPALVICLHGSGMNGKKMRQWTSYEMDVIADQRGFIVLYPDGYKGNWNDCRKDSPHPASKENVDDVSFMESLVAKAANDYDINPEKVYIFGYSNGGQMAFRMCLERPQLFSAACSIAANMPALDSLLCNSSGKTPRIMLVAGTADTISPYHGGKVSLFGFKRIGTCVSANDTGKYFAMRNSANDESTVINEEIGIMKDSLLVNVKTWKISGKSVIKLYSIRNGGHVIPQPFYRFPRVMGKTALNFNSPLKALDFFLDKQP